MKFSRIRSAAMAVGLTASTLTACAQQADFDEVGCQMAIMLQNSHFARLKFNDMSQRFLDDFLRDLDSGKSYFTQEDIDRFNRQYGDNLAEMLMKKESMAAAIDIYGTFKKRVEARVAEGKRVLAANEFDFAKEESIQRSRKDAAWPKTEEEAMQLWRQQIKEAVLSETLRRDMIAQMAAKQGKENPLKADKDPKEKIALRYERFLHSVVQDVDDEDVAAMFLSAVARSFDPHTDYMSTREMDRFRDGMKNELVGIGALLQGEEDGATKIMGIVVGGPADKQGTLKLNDRIVAVDPDGDGPREMVDIMFMKIDKVVDLIRGQEATPVRLKAEPAGGAPGETVLINIVRAKVALKDEQASAEIIDMKAPSGEATRLGIITLPSFYADFDEGKVRCSVDVERLLERLKEEGIDGLMLDLRNNGGGALEEVRRMTGFFTPRGPVVQVKNTFGERQVKESDRKEPIYDGPMIVLTDKSSASASEILAGALQDNNRAVIVGESSTFGKGTVQQPMDISRMLPFFKARDKAGTLKVTIQKFYRPSGSSTQKMGVIPDVVLPSLTDALEVGEAFLDHPLEHDLIGRAPDFNPMKKEQLFLQTLKDLSTKRVSASKDFSYIIEDVTKAKARIRENSISLNMAERKKELDEIDAQQQQRNAERKERFAGVQTTDKKDMTFFKLTLDDVEKGADIQKYDPSAETEGYMRKAKDETAELDETPPWPSALDPHKREGVQILGDLVDVTRNARMAGMIER
ncbi:carboxy terminal-processing peptidase [Luteolibacter sp. GHJ8]|uniref:Carboxy terminal-processing peptidase n=1 Tax=Luteolibacter rhizosphaerae TaxID=2989719 RepID=A0ABT3FYW1_9BACT|nr:carboxy terminal-processing peptidase [Luteolibacter rhizosphaerae]MCW1912761.1 carboxy terminal-processing peptidase [Luteolibacter rhizosphaerae]